MEPNEITWSPHKPYLDINTVSHEVKLLILAAVFERMDNNAEQFEATYGTTVEDIKSDVTMLDGFIYDLEKCCLYTRTLRDLIGDYNRNADGYIDVPSTNKLRGMDLYNAVKAYWIIDDVITVVTVDDIDWCISFID